jgi:hypothetical protein
MGNRGLGNRCGRRLRLHQIRRAGHVEERRGIDAFATWNREAGESRAAQAALCGYAEGVKVSVGVQLALLLATLARSQNPGVRVLRFEDYPVKELFKGTPSEPVLISAEERRFRTVIRRGVSKGWGVEDGATGKELAVPGANFAGRYVIVHWGCGSPCLMAAVVDAKTGRVFPPPFNRGPGHSYFQVPWAFPMRPALAYRLDSRLLIANICETDKAVQVDGRAGYQALKCGAHYFVMGKDGLRLIHKVLEED